MIIFYLPIVYFFFWNRFREVVENSVQKDVENFSILYIVLK